ncbi:MAG TPA: 5-oxoprolinase subunit PxpA [Candidatus Dormibacteraeota bacterium]|nr:5-oxoprolinase subunit PxpA [Candidatus Dormibacteraeota bacterium]
MAGRVVDLNCDMGESFGAWKMGDDERMFPSISSANVACGFHGGDPRVMARTVHVAKEHGVAVGAHPSFPDLVGFGRRNLNVTADEARTDVLYQIGAVFAFCRRFGVPLQHVKPHGQLNNLAMTDRALADAIVAGIKDFDPALLVVSYGGEFAKAAEAAGMRVAYEVFADREYNADGTLVSRRLPGAVITDPERVVERAVAMVREGRVRAVDGAWLDIPVHTICTHGDTPGAADLAARLRGALQSAGVRIAPMAEVVAEAATVPR